MCPLGNEETSISLSRNERVFINDISSINVEDNLYQPHSVWEEETQNEG